MLRHLLQSIHLRLLLLHLVELLLQLTGFGEVAVAFLLLDLLLEVFIACWWASVAGFELILHFAELAWRALP